MVRRIPPGKTCYRCGKKAERRERDNKRIETGKYICLKCYDINYKYGITYKKPEKYYNDSNSCEFIKESGIRCSEILYGGNARKFVIDNKLIWYCKQHANWYERRLPNSWNSIIKSMSKRRTGNLESSSAQTKGDISEKLSCILFSAKNLNEDNDNYIFPIDNWCEKLGYFQTRGKWYDSYNKYWQFGNLENYRFVDFDNLVTYCISKDGNKIERIYIFPYEIVIARTGITIIMNPSNRNGRCPIPGGWYEIYRIIDGDIIKSANIIWDTLLKEMRKK